MSAPYRDLLMVLTPRELVIEPWRDMGAFRDLTGPGIPVPPAWDLQFDPASEISNAAFRESGTAVFKRPGGRSWDICAFQRSCNHFGLYPWNLAVTVEEDGGGKHTVRDVRISKAVKGARGELCLREYLLRLLKSQLVGRPFDASLLPFATPLRLQCIHIVEQVRQALGAFMYAGSEALTRAGAPEAAGDGPPIYARSELTRVVRVKEEDVFCFLGLVCESFFTHSGRQDRRSHYQFSIPFIQDALSVRENGWVDIGRLRAYLQGTGAPFGAARELTGAAGIDSFVAGTIGPALNPYYVLSGNLKDIVTFLKLAPTLRFPFGPGFNPEFYGRVMRKNSFCIGWRPELAGR